MIDYVIHNAAGEILQTGNVIESLLMLQGDSLADRFAIEGKGDATEHWVWDGAIVSRPTLDARVSASEVRADGVDAVVINGILAGALVTVSGPMEMSGIADGENITMTFALPGRYTIVTQLFPFKDLEVTVNAI